MQLKAIRSALFVPALARERWAKAAAAGADAVIVDLEDSVPPDRKAEARGLVAQAVDAIAGHVPVLVRVNAEADLVLADLAALPLERVDAVMLPKVASASQVTAVASHAARLCPARPQALPLVALVETAMGVLQAHAIAVASPALVALGFGAEDYAAEMGVPPLPASLAWPAQQVATCARAHGLACWGLPGSVAEIADMAAFGETVALARTLGFTGTVCIHPRQVPLANAGFGPTEADLAWARRVADAAAAQSVAGAAFALDGRMVDRPIVERALRWLAQHGGR